MMLRAMALGAMLMVSAGQVVAQERLYGVASVIDGDTLEIHGMRIRLHGIDAPESAQLCERPSGKTWRCGQQASLALSDRIGSSSVTCRRTDTDRYGRMVAVCTEEGGDINAWMVAEGWAVAYTSYSRDYAGLEVTAKAASSNIWSGAFVMPWDWRRGQRVVETRPPRDARRTGCDIKGNVNRRGDRIYHLPAEHSYARTRIDEGKGERWFCSEEEARQAGWRRSGR